MRCPTYLDRANRAAPTDLPVLHTTANLLVLAGRGDDAVERYRLDRLAASMMPTDIDIRGGCARAALMLRDHSQALILFEQALELEPAYANPGGWLEEIVRETLDVDTACDWLNVLVAYPTGWFGCKSWRRRSGARSLSVGARYRRQQRDRAVGNRGDRQLATRS
jgi:tetratricopeptide (TPR) repeat protein